MNHNPGAERAILSLCISNKDNLVELDTLGFLPDYFQIPVHRNLYMAISHLAMQPNVKTLDALTVYNAITDPAAKQRLDDIGGMEYISALETTELSQNVEFFANIMRGFYLSKRMSVVMQNAIDMLKERNVDEAMQYVQNQLLQMSSVTTIEVKHLGEGFMEALRQRIENPCDVKGYQLGWPKWDSWTQGFGSNDLVIFVAPSKTGKSTILLNAAKILAVDAGISGLYIDTEMLTEEQNDKIVSIISKVPYTEISNGMCSRDTDAGLGGFKMKAIEKADELLRSAPLYHVYLPDFTLEKVNALVHKYKSLYNIGFVVFDYIKLPSGGKEVTAQAQEYQQLGFFTMGLKNLAGLLKIPVLAAAQTNDEMGSETRPGQKFLAGAKRILWPATKLVYLRNKTIEELAVEGVDRGNQKLIIEYQRFGGSQLDPIDMFFDHDILTMNEV